MLTKDMKGFLVRVAADKTDGGGRWNGPVNSETGEFVYVPIPETKPVHRGLEKPYSLIGPALGAFAVMLPSHLADRRMHLDPDFEHLTYGDRGSKGRQLSSSLRRDDFLVFYAGLNAVPSDTLIYAIIGGLSVKDGYIQRSAVFPRLLNVSKFMSWWHDQNPELLRLNNPVA